MAFFINNTNLLTVANNLSHLSAQLATSNLRLSTGLRINSAADDPVGIVSIANLSSRMAQIDGVISNGNRIGSIAETAGSGLKEMSTLIESIQANTIAASSSSTTADERAAYQAEIDLAIEAIDRLVSTTAYNGTKLLDGSIGYNTSGVDNTKIADVHLSTANVDSGNLTVSIVNEAADYGEITISYAEASPSTDVTFTITGDLGSREYTFSAGASRATIASTVNADAGSTGVTASYDGNKIYFRTAQTGSDQQVAINVTSGTYNMDGGVTSDYGQDAGITVNGIKATVDDREVQFGTGSISGRFTISESFQSTSGASTSFVITGGGAGYRLDNTSTGKVEFGQSSMRSTALGNDELGYLSSLKSGGDNALATENYTAALNIANKAAGQIAAANAKWGAIKTYSVDSTVNSLTAAKTAMATEKSFIMDLDFAQETANNNRLQILMQVGTQVLAAMNQNSSNILSLLQF